MDRLLVIKLGAFGDIMQAAGALQDIRAHHAGAELIVMTSPAYGRVFERCPWVDRVFLDPREPRWRLDRMMVLARRLRGLRVDFVYDLQQVGRTGWYRRRLLPGVPWFDPVVDPDTLRDKGTMDRIALQLAAGGLTVRHALRPDLGWMVEDMGWLLARRNIHPPYAVLIPGASAGRKEKRWPWYDELAVWLGRQGVMAVTVPGPDELDLCRSLSHAVMLTDGDRYLDFFELAGVLRSADFVVGNDTGPTHLAAHLGRPGLALFSGHLSPRRTGIQHSRFSWLECEDLRTLSLTRVREELLPLVPSRS